MAKKDTPEDPKKLEEQKYQAAIEEKVREMLEPEPKKASPAEAKAEATTAPELAVPGAEDSTPENVVDSDSGTPAEAEEPTDEPEVVKPEESEQVEIASDEETDKAVDEIVEQESDDLMAAEDEKLAEAFSDKKPSIFSRFKDGWHKWWANPVKKWSTIAGLVILVVAAVTVPNSRYFLLNTAGVRSSLSMTVLDDSTQQPLRGVKVSVGTVSAESDKDGKVRLDRLRLGRTHLMIEKRAFARVDQVVTLGWGSNPLGETKLKPTGSQYTFLFTDYLSGKPVDDVEATSDDASALSNEEGKLLLTIDKEAAQKNELEVTIKADEYRTETVTLNLNSSDEVKLQLVPARKHVFISRRSGKYDVFKIDVDGTHEERILAGTGYERDDMVLVQHPAKPLVALVSTRENAHNSDGFLLSTLTTIDLATNEVTKVAQSERIQIVNWSGDRLVFVQIAAGASAANPKRHRLISYDVSTGQSKELAASNYFNDVFAINGTIYYAPSSAYTSEKASLFKVNADGSNKQTAFAQEVWNIFRVDYDKLVLAVNQDWYEYKISDGKTTKLAGEPANLRSRVYVDSPDHTQSLWVDNRDGKGVLLAYDLSTKTDKVLQQRSGLSTPVQWLSKNAVVFRVSTTQETADYVMSLNGGEPKKLRDVTNTTGVDRWYYY